MYPPSGPPDRVDMDDQLPCLPLSSVCNHGEGQEGERVRHARLHHPPQQAVVWRDLQEARAAGCEGGEEVRPADDEDQVC